MNSVPIRHIQNALELFRTLDNELSMGVMVTLLMLADGTEREMKSLLVMTGLGQTSLNRALLYLGDRHWSRNSRKGGLFLVEKRVNPSDERMKLVKLTKKGRQFIRNLEVGTL